MTTALPAPVRRTALAAAALAALLGLAACGADGGSSAPAAGQAAQAAAHDEADVAFVRGMLPHHEQAVEMSDLVLAAGPSPEVRALAEAVKAAQQPEIAQLEALLEAFGAEAEGGGGHGGHGGGHTGAGMLSASELEALGQARGAEAERLFLQGMLEHHRGAVEMADEQVARGRHPEAVALARTIRREQQAEIALMERLLARP